MLSKEAIQAFKKLYWEKFREKLSDNEALIRATKLLNLYRTVYGPASYGQIKKVENSNEKSNQQP